MSSAKVTGLYRSDTDKAVLLRVPVDNGEQGFTDDVWFPRSQISHIHKEPTGPEKLNYNWTITIPDWLVDRNKVIIDEMLPEDYFDARKGSPLDLPGGLREREPAPPMSVDDQKFMQWVEEAMQENPGQVTGDDLRRFTKLNRLLEKGEVVLSKGVTPDGSYYDALRKCAERYREMTPADSPLEKFLLQFVDGIEQRMPLMKLNRWLGYIQGRLIAADITTVKAERDWTRPLFAPLDTGEDSPLTD